MSDGKPIAQSRTIRINALAALVLMFPSSEKFIAGHPRGTFLGLIAVNFVLRLITKDRLKLEIPMLNRILVGMFVFLAIVLSSCATIRTDSIFNLRFSDQPTRVAVRGVCGSQTFTTQGTVVCEQRQPSIAHISIKIPPLPGRVMFSNGQLKSTADFNWYPKEGFLIWKKTPIKDTWIDLDLGEIAATFGDWPVALDVAALDDKVGEIVTRGVMYYRICNDQDIPCSKLVVRYECAGFQKATGPGTIGKCERVSGSPQAFRVALSDQAAGYAATPGAKLYITAPRMGVAWPITLSPADFVAGEYKFEIPPVLTGPTLIGIGMEWLDASGRIQKAETRVLINGFSPDWSGMDKPHSIHDGDDDGDKFDLAKPYMADIMEADLYQGQTLVSRKFGTDQVINFPIPKDAQVACAFAWERQSSDLSLLCVDAKLNEVPLP